MIRGAVVEEAGSRAVKRSDVDGERTHEEAPSVEEPRPLSITKTTAMAAATAAIGIYMAQLIAGNIAFGAPGSRYRTACMTTLIAGLGAWGWRWDTELDPGGWTGIVTC